MSTQVIIQPNNQTVTVTEDQVTIINAAAFASLPLPISEGGTGATTASEGLDALLPDQSGQNGKVLGTDGTSASWVSGGGGGSPAGSSNDVQINSSGSFGAVSSNTSTTREFLRQVGTGSASTPPVWDTVTKTDVGLSNVENAALSTWPGSSNLTTVGTIGTGTWAGTAVAIAHGGTGQTTANAAFNALAPSQTSQNGKFLTTDGTNTSWASVSASPGGSSGQIQYNASGNFAGAAALTTASGNPLTVTAQSATDVPVVVKGAASQSGDLQEWKDSTSATLAKVDSNGDITTLSKIYFNDSNGWIRRTAGTNTMFFAPSIGSEIMMLTNAKLTLLNGLCELLGDTANTDAEVRTPNKGGNGGTGLRLLLHAGNGSSSASPTKGGDVQVYGGNGAAGNTNGGDVQIYGGSKFGIGTDGNVQIGYDGSTAKSNVAMFGAGSFGGGVNVFFVGTATTAPTTNPTGGFLLYVDPADNKLKARGPSGTVTTLATP